MVMIIRNKKSIGFWLLIISFWLLVNHIPYSIFHLPSSMAAADPNSHRKSKLWQIELNMPEDEEDKITKNELRSMIEQIRSINIGIRKDEPEPVVVPDKMPIDEPNEIEIKSKDTEEKQKKQIKSSPTNGIIANQTLQKIKKLSLNPSDLKNPFEMGETLFLSGYLQEAAIFYQEALIRRSVDDTDSSRAWILFQIGNCLRNYDRPTAIRMYGQLIAEYPNSIWKELAEVRRSLLAWYLKEEPHKLVNEYKR
jgi:tetratricopeptide (TPR) repeat protein